jgi:hypothetical protein
MKPRFLFVVAVLSLVARGLSADDRIQPYPKNPFYWQYKSKPVLLLGGSVEDNLFQIPKLTEHLDLLKSVGGNYVRNTMSGRDPGNVWPFAKAGDKYDLERFNPEYWKRFETFLAETAKRDIIVQIEIWATFDYYRDLWRDQNPFAPKNNINYTTTSSQLKNLVNSHPVRAQNDFFRSVPEAKNLTEVLKYQERFVAKILEHSLKYDNVLYCMDNETAVTPKWGAYWATFIKRQAAKHGTVAEVTDMWDPWDLANRKHDAIFKHPEVFTYLDISQNNHQKGQKHYDNPLARRNSIKQQPRPINNVKIYGADGGRFGNTRDGIERFWRNIFGGHAAVRFHRPDSGLGLSALAQRNIQSARQATNAFDIFVCDPRNDLLSDRNDNEAYCLARPGDQYAVYFPAGGQVKLDIKLAQRKLSLQWYDIDDGQSKPPADVPAGKSLALEAPGPGQWAAVIKTFESIEH